MKIKVIGVGGAGCNVAMFLKSTLPKENRSVIDYYFIDTSKNNVDESAVNGNFMHIKSSDINGDVLNGSGGKTSTNAVHISKAIENFINDKKLHQSKDLNIIISSISGSSGSVAINEFAKRLLGTDATMVGVVISDSSTYQYLDNSISGIVRLNSVSKKLGALTLLQFNNNEYENEDGHSKIDICNRDILSVIDTVSVFTSGENKDIDDKDMEFLFKPHMYDKLNIEHGLYTLLAGSCKFTDSELKSKSVLIGRTLKHENSEKNSPLSTYPLLQHKEGYTSADLETCQHLDLLVCNNFDDIYKNMVSLKERFKTKIEKSTIPVIESDADEY